MRTLHVSLMSKSPYPSLFHRVIAKTSTGCLLGGSAIGKRGRWSQIHSDYFYCTCYILSEDPPYKTGRAAADQVLKAVREGACVDEHLQDQVSR